MNYSCAYFRTGTEDIDTAQEAKLEHICRKLRFKPGERLLDIGCGWGGLVIYAAQRYGVRALGVTLSEKQYALANERIAAAGLTDRAAVNLLDYRDLSNAQFDKIVSVGMFEHVGRGHLPEYFAHAYRLLKPGGLFLNHGISTAHPQTRQKKSAWTQFIERNVLGSGQFVWRYIFPDGELEPVSEVNLVAEAAGFEVRDVENLREHTCPGGNASARVTHSPCGIGSSGWKWSGIKPCDLSAIRCIARGDCIWLARRWVSNRAASTSIKRCSPSRRRAQ